jgi:hypothetical protein
LRAVVADALAAPSKPTIKLLVVLVAVLQAHKLLAVMAAHHGVAVRLVQRELLALVELAAFIQLLQAAAAAAAILAAAAAAATTVVLVLTAAVAAVAALAFTLLAVRVHKVFKLVMVKLSSRTLQVLLP